MATTCNFIDNDFYRSWTRKSDMLNEESWLENLVSPYKWLSFLFDQQRVQGSSFWLLDGKVGSGLCQEISMINRWKTVTISYYEIRLMIKMEQSECQSIKLEKIPLDRKLIRKVSRPFILKKKKNK